LTSRTHIKTLE